MSFTTDAPAEGAPTAPVTTDTGTPTSAPVDAAPVAPAVPTEPAAPASDGELFTVKVNGEELQVSREELLNGYSRTQDYTRKTQEVAAEAKALKEAKALQAAFDRDPHATLEALADAFNWSPQGAQPAGEAQVPFEELDPLEQRVVRAEQFMETQQQKAVRQAIEADVAYLQQTYGPDVDIDAVAAHAVERGLDLKTAYKDMHFDAVRQTEAANAAAVDAKRAAQVVEGAGTVQPGTVSAPPPQLSLRDTIRAAIRAA